MAITSGFFTSSNGDRKYTAEQMSAIFEGFITDGIFQTIGSCFKTSYLSGRDIKIDTGRAWFNNIWIYNDAIVTLTDPVSEAVLDRWDTVIVEVNKTQSVRECSFKIITGVPATTPSKPSLSQTDGIYQYPLAYIYVAKGSENLSDDDITNAVGTDDCPYAGLVNQAQWLADEKKIIDKWFSLEQTDFTEWQKNEQMNFGTWLSDLHKNISEDTIAKYATDVAAVKQVINGLFTIENEALISHAHIDDNTSYVFDGGDSANV